MNVGIAETTNPADYYKSIIIDGNIVDLNISKWTFENAGEHVVEYELLGKTVWLNSVAASKIIIPEGVDCLNNYSLAYCENLQELVLPASLKTINEGVFCESYRITELYYNGKVESCNFTNNNDRWFSWNISQIGQISKVICIDGTITIERPIPTVDWISCDTESMQLSVGQTENVYFFIKNNTIGDITTAENSHPDQSSGNYYYFEYDENALTVTSESNGWGQYDIYITAKQAGVYDFYIKAGPGELSDQEWVFEITIS